MSTNGLKYKCIIFFGNPASFPTSFRHLYTSFNFYRIDMTNKKSTLTGFGAAVLAVLGSISCCGAPIAAGILASAGIGASQLEFLHSIQYYLIGISFIALGIGFYKSYFQKNKSCCAVDSPQKPSKTARLFLWILSIITLGILFHSLRIEASESDRSCCPAQSTTQESCCTKIQQ